MDVCYPNHSLSNVPGFGMLNLLVSVTKECIGMKAHYTAKGLPQQFDHFPDPYGSAPAPNKTPTLASKWTR